ncbi:TetR family transcriptional regulator [Nocardioides baekrokdamisoli]|uniref:TetR family transcriptional regulator n=1 Tax=Nocardioides baekrokdamisoli TaxID=1804624 RepID=A0A3G9IGU7_9ACTN|nr:TetR/AcrR family transcriptional regulator [Nocardioides baekrokdamisoli]BBH17566.1 TetR family transcriptional regulator [Nocardioides baekrokdamisoli]
MSTRIRLTPEDRREQLLELGVAMIGERPIDEFSIDALAHDASISRGLLYHYFGSKQDFVRAVLRRMADGLFEATAPVDDPSLEVRLRVSIQAYLRWVGANLTGYVSFLQEAQRGNNEVRDIYLSARAALTDRIFDSCSAEELAAYGISDLPRVRMFARSWAAMVEDVVLNWINDPQDLSEDEIVASLTRSLAGVLGAVSA